MKQGCLGRRSRALDVWTITALICAAALLNAHPVHAAGVVTTCDEAHLDTALSGGGLVTFNCGGAIDNTTAGAKADTAPNYALVNGRLQFAGIPLAKGSLNLAVFGRNLFDKEYRNFGIDFSPAVGWSIDTYGPPRTFGLELAYNFSQE